MAKKKVRKKVERKYGDKKIKTGIGLFLFGLLWWKFDSLPIALMIIGLLIAIWGLIVRYAE